MWKAVYWNLWKSKHPRKHTILAVFCDLQGAINILLKAFWWREDYHHGTWKCYTWSSICLATFWAKNVVEKMTKKECWWFFLCTKKRLKWWSAPAHGTSSQRPVWLILSENCQLCRVRKPKMDLLVFARRFSATKTVEIHTWARSKNILLVKNKIRI